ncbi:hypothetical protein [Corynebacterium urogenitale]|nr:hypothetical protein [Corynebacterium urogenitale]
MTSFPRTFMAPRFEKTAFALSSIVLLGLSLAACSDAPSEEQASETGSAAPSSENTGPQPTLATSASRETEEGEDDPFSQILSQAPSDAHYAKVDITADGEPELLLETQDIAADKGWHRVSVYDSQGEKYSATVHGEEGFLHRAGHATMDRSMLQATADHNGLLFSTWHGTRPDVHTELWTVDGQALVLSGKDWDYRWKGLDSGIQDQAPADLKASAQEIEWKDVNPSGDGSESAASGRDSNGGSSRGGASTQGSASAGQQSASDSQIGGTCGTIAGQPVVAGSSTSCGFAMDVARLGTAGTHPVAYWPVTVTSRQTGKTYTMSCGIAGPADRVWCKDMNGGTAEVTVGPGENGSWNHLVE